MSGTYSYIKVLEYVCNLATHDVEVITETGKKLHFSEPEEIAISPLFFRGDGCERCGKCCKAFTTVFTEEGLNRIQSATKEDYGKLHLDYSFNQKLLNELIEVEVQVNGEPKIFYLDNPDKEHVESKKCKHVGFDGELSYCDIHPVRSVTCMLPHNQIRKHGNNTNILKMQYGRNWKLGCPVEFDKFNYNMLIHEDIKTFTLLLTIARDLGVDTVIPKFLTILEQLKPDLKMGKVPTEKIVIHKKHPKNKKLF